MKEIKVGDRVVYRVDYSTYIEGDVIAVTENFIKVKRWFGSVWIPKEKVEVITSPSSQK